MNSKNDNKTNTRELQLHEMDILKAFIKICEENQLTYYAVGGTLLGAVRHKGFIPWDDDMDLAMPRYDYDLFIRKYYKQLPNNIKVNDFHLKKSKVYFYPMKLENRDVKVVEQRLEHTGQFSYLSIDVFPIDGLPDGKFRRYLYYLNFYKYKALIGFCNIDILRQNVKRSVLEKIMIRLGKTFKIGNHINLKRTQYKYESFLRKNTKLKGHLKGDITGAYGFREFVPQHYWGKGRYLPFEDIEVHVPTDWHNYLKHIYGDYMQLPPIEKRQAGHLRILSD